MELATFIGISVKDFWDMTLAELNISANSYYKRKEIEDKSNIYNAYLISRWVWQEKIDIEKILNIDNKAEKREMSDEQLYKQVLILNKLLGGEVEYE